MNHDGPITTPPQSFSVYEAETFLVINGANLGDAIGVAEDLVLDDVYALRGGAKPQRLAVLTRPDGSRQIGEGSGLGRIGATLHLDCSLSLMSPDGEVIEAIVLVEVDGIGAIAATYLLPLAPISAQRDYSLVGIDRARAKESFAQIACVSFVRGTSITLATGAQKPIEELAVGDRVLTRDDGVQPVRWIGQTTTRATGAFAPILIKAGALNNAGDLIVSPEHRLFIYQRSDPLAIGRSELLVRARHLVNGDSITVMDGGFIDYFQLLFDRHQIVYAEGIAAETLLVDPRTTSALPEQVKHKFEKTLSGHARSPHLGLDVDKTLLARPNAADLLRLASRR